jgi:uncharacterized cupredoxin-like copper-binding protein
MHPPAFLGRLTGPMMALLLGLLLIASACGDSNETSSGGTPSSTATESPGGGGGGTVQATQKDFSIALSPGTASAGSVTFDITNDGPSTHEFVIFKSDLDDDQLPTDDSGNEVDEEGQGVSHVDEEEDIAANSSATLTVDLQPGTYVVICNLPGHYKLGMHATLTVS